MPRERDRQGEGDGPAATGRLECPRCGRPNPHRRERKGFLEKGIYNLFGYYPWKCKRCRAGFYLKRRHREHAEAPGE